MQQSAVPAVERWMAVLLLATKNAGPANGPHAHEPLSPELPASRMRRIPPMAPASKPRRTTPRGPAGEKRIQVVQDAPPMAARHIASSRTSKLLQLAADLHLV